MFIPVLAVLLAIAANCVADDKAVQEQLEDLVSETILDELADADESSEVSAAVRYMIPVPIHVVVPAPRPQPVQQPPYPDRDRDPILAVPIGVTPGRYPSWRPIGPPVIAIPVGSATGYPLPDRDDDFERRTLAGPQRSQRAQRVRTSAATRRTRSIDKTQFKAEEQEKEELTADMSAKEEPARGIHRQDNPLKVSVKMNHKGYKSQEKLYRPKRQVGSYVVRGGYMRPAPIRVVLPGVTPGQVVVAPYPHTQVVPVPVYVPVPIDQTI